MMRATTILQLHPSLRGFARDHAGVSAVEFAVVLPLMLALYLGSVELGNGLAVQFRTTLAARTVADLASQYVAIDGPIMHGILGAASTVIAPYSGANMVVTVSEVTTDSKGQGSITWSDSLNGTPRPVGQPVTLPANLQTPNISIIWGEVTYPYKPNTGYVVTGTITLYKSTYFYPRLSTTIACNGC
jgi:Flp pilus assembly protein TadG